MTRFSNCSTSAWENAPALRNFFQQISDPWRSLTKNSFMPVLLTVRRVILDLQVGRGKQVVAELATSCQTGSAVASGRPLRGPRTIGRARPGARGAST